MREAYWRECEIRAERGARIAELERKLAEQQAGFKKLHEFVRGTELEPELNGEELNTLLAQAREEGRKESVPDGLTGFSMALCREEWGCGIDGLILERERSEKRKAANSESTSNERAAMCVELIDRINNCSAEAMICAAAPTPGEKC